LISRSTNARRTEGINQSKKGEEEVFTCEGKGLKQQRGHIEPYLVLSCSLFEQVEGVDSYLSLAQYQLGRSRCAGSVEWHFGWPEERPHSRLES
jgi:hypothetical protein